MAYDQAHKFRLAIADLDFVIEKDHRTAEAHFQRALAYAALGDEERSSEDAAAAVRLGLDEASVNRHLSYRKKRHAEGDAGEGRG